MYFDPTVLIIFGVALVVVAMWWRNKSVNIENSKGNFIGGNVDGDTTQNYTGDTVPVSGDAGKVGLKEIITWLIALLGVVVAGFGVYHIWFVK